nr:MAG TPA: hypothetical protein [Caudoviricetes sp.]
MRKMKLKNQVKNQNNLRFFIVAVRLSNWLYIENYAKNEAKKSSQKSK